MSESKTMPLGAVAMRLSHLSPLARRQLLNRLGLVAGQPDIPVTAAQRFVLYAADFLAGVMPVKSDVSRAVVEAYWPQLTAAGEVVGAGGPRLPAIRLAVLDRRYVSVSGTLGFMDMNAGCTVEKLSAAPVETITYDLTALFVHTEARR